MNSYSSNPDRRSEISRAQGCLLGQLAGDALGSLVEFQSPEQIRRDYPGGVREMADGGTWNTIAGQPTDDSEMALLLARMLTERDIYDSEAALAAYQFWLDSDPFDCGMTIATGLRGRPNPDSQANPKFLTHRQDNSFIFNQQSTISGYLAWEHPD